MEFAEKVRFVKKRLALLQEDLACALNVSFSTVNRWENGRTVPNKMAQTVFYAFSKKRGIAFDAV